MANVSSGLRIQLIAAGRRHVAADAIFIINLTLGWTVVFWLWMLVDGLFGHARERRV